MKKFKEIKKNVTEFLSDNIAEITLSTVAVGYIGLVCWSIYKTTKIENEGIDSFSDSLTYTLSNAKIQFTVPDAENIEESLKYIRENNVLNPLDCDEFKRVIDAFIEKQNDLN